MGARDQERGRGWSRRQFLGALTLAGGGVLLAACGGTVATPTSPPPVVPTQTAAQATAVATAVPATATIAPASPTTRPAPPTTPGTPVGTPTGTPGGTPGGGTPVRPGSPSAASPTPTVRANPAFGRMLALVPQKDPLPGADGIMFADIATQKRNYGMADVTSVESRDKLTEAQWLTFQNAVSLALPTPDETGRNYALQPEWRETLGYDYWQVDRTIQAGSPPQQWTRMEGRFDRAAIGAALETAGHKPSSYGGATIQSRGQDGQVVNLQEPFSRFTLARLNRVVLEDGAFSSTSQTALAQAGIDTAAGRAPSFAADLDYAALIVALGPVVGAILTKPDLFYGTASPSTRPTSTPTPSRTATGTPVVNRLPPYSRVGLGLRDDGKDHAMVIALVYADLENARTAAAVVLRRVGEYRLTANGQQLSERAVASTTELVTVGDRTVVVVPLKILDEVSLSLWLRMYGNRDYQFLAP